ncbi:cation transporter [Akkermansiaceae bacterium]|nr:cation transporter [Akkermansiaceae bacterium]
MGCVNKVRSALEGVEGVSKAAVSMPDSAVVTAKSSVSDKDLVKAVKDAGFGASVTK